MKAIVSLITASLMLKPGVGVCGAEFSFNVFLAETVR